MKNFFPIKIDYASNGIIVKAGCLLIVYQQTQLNMFHNDIGAYLVDPVATEKEIRKRWHIEETDSESPEEEPDPRTQVSRTIQARETEEEKAPR